jgi:hypothetical protein
MTGVPLFDVVELVLRPGAPWTTGQRAVAICVASHMDKQGEAWPSELKIQERTGLSRTAVRLAIRRLCSGPDAVFERTTGTGRVSTRYRLIQRAATCPPEGRETPLWNEHENLESVPVGDTENPRGGYHVYTEQSIEQPIEQPKAVVPLASQATQPFDAFGADPSAWFSPKPDGRQKRRAKTPAPGVVQRMPSWSRDACDDWIAGTGGTAPGGRIGKALHPLVTKLGWPAVRPAWTEFCSGGESKYGPEHFANHYGEFAGRSLAYVVTDEGLPF